MTVTLIDLAATEGYELVVVEYPEMHPDAKGKPSWDSFAVALTQKRIAVKSLSMGNVYSVAHEIAEDYTGFNGHSDLMWMTQANLLARWCIYIARPDSIALAKPITV